MAGTQMMHRRDAVRALFDPRGDVLVVVGLGTSVGDMVTTNGEHPLNFCMAGAMGGACAMGLGLALAQPEKRAVVITGDGELLMGLSSLATIGAKRPANFALVVTDNERYSETGGQRTVTADGVDIATMAKGAGFRDTMVVREEGQLTAARKMMREAPGPVCIVLKVDPENLPAVARTRDGAWGKNRFREALLGKI